MVYYGREGLPGEGTTRCAKGGGQTSGIGTWPRSSWLKESDGKARKRDQSTMVLRREASIIPCTLSRPLRALLRPPALSRTSSIRSGQAQPDGPGAVSELPGPAGPATSASAGRRAADAASSWGRPLSARPGSPARRDRTVPPKGGLLEAASVARPNRLRATGWFEIGQGAELGPP